MGRPVYTDFSSAITPLRDQAADVVRSTMENLKEMYNINFVAKRNQDDIYDDESIFNEFVDGFSQGLNEDDGEKELFEQMLQTNRSDFFLAESNTVDFAPYIVLQGTMLRRFLPKLVVKETFPVEVAQKPHFRIYYNEPYYTDINGVTTKLVDYFKQIMNTSDDFSGMHPIFNGYIPIDNARQINLITGANPVGVVPGFVDLVAALKVNALDKLDRNLVVAKVQVRLGIGLTGAAYDPLNDPVYEINVNVKKNFDNLIDGIISFTSDASLVAGSLTTSPVPLGTVFTDRLFAKIDEKTSVMYARALNTPQTQGKLYIEAISLIGHVSTENQFVNSEASLEIGQKEFAIGVGEHISAPFPEEWAKDINVLYNIDGQLKIAELMSDVLARKTEAEAWKWIKAWYTQYNMASLGFFAQFDIRPNVAFAGRPKDWLEEMKRYIDLLTRKIRNYTSFPGGKFIILGNPIDTALIPNVNWIYVSAETERSGVDNPGYNVGSYVGAGEYYEVVSGTHLPQGGLYLLYYPKDPEIMTMKYYPYTFTVHSGDGYRNARRPNLPSITMTKRHLFGEFTPYIAYLQINNNDLDNLTAYRP